jgi:hypothetical protein
VSLRFDDANAFARRGACNAGPAAGGLQPPREHGEGAIAHGERGANELSFPVAKPFIRAGDRLVWRAG